MINVRLGLSGQVIKAVCLILSTWSVYTEVAGLSCTEDRLGLTPIFIDKDASFPTVGLVRTNNQTLAFLGRGFELSPNTSM